MSTTNRAGAEDAARHLLAHGRRRPLMVTGSALFGCTQERSKGFLETYAAMQRLRAAGRTVPQDVAVVGFDDVALALQTDPPLTSVHQPLSEMGQTAALMLLSYLDGSAGMGIPDIIPTSFVVRASSGSP